MGSHIAAVLLSQPNHIHQEYEVGYLKKEKKKASSITESTVG